MSKYHNKITYVDGIKFDSGREADYYVIYKNLQRNGKISNLRMQVPFELIPAVYREEVKHLKTKDKIVQRCIQKSTHYYADFVYDDIDGKTHVIDVKGRRTKEYSLKKKMMLAFKNIEIEEVK